MNSAAFTTTLAARLAVCAMASTNNDFSRAADRLANLGGNATSAQRQREVNAAGKRALDAYLARSKR